MTASTTQEARREESPRQPRHRPGRRRTAAVFGLLGVLLVVAVTAGVAFGSITIPVGTVWQIVVHRLTGWGDPSRWSQIQDAIVWRLRMPRVLLAAVVGAGLAVVGVAVQALVRNPLADPYLLGVTSGASVGAVTALVLGVGAVGIASIGAAAFVGALATFVVVYLLARGGGSFAPTRLLLVGAAMAYGLYGLTTFLVMQADDPGKTNSVLFWLLGSLAGVSWSNLGIPTVALAVGILALLARARALNALLMGDETAASLGVAPARLRKELFAVASLVTGIMVALSGGIGFVGLVVPHGVRLLLGSDHRKVLVGSALAGAVFLVVVDLLARFVLRPEELPAGVLTSIIGAPALLLLISRRRISETGL